MLTITTVADMQAWADDARSRGRRIGLVPTMGYLHAGHLSLVAESQRRTDTTVVSIFVNPLQFGANEDLDCYPRDIGGDIARLTEAGADVLFLPNLASMYPEGVQTTVSVERLTRGLCGAARPTHFRGVTTVVAKLFNIVKPHVAVFGRKDYQQYVVIRQMAADLNFDIEVVGAAIVREPDGIAMSSRNSYLNPAERQAARCLAQALQAAAAQAAQGETHAAAILDTVHALIGAEPLARLEYASLAHPDTLAEVSEVRGPTLLALAVHVGKTRLIDNCVLRNKLQATSGKLQGASCKLQASSDKLQAASAEPQERRLKP